MGIWILWFGYCADFLEFMWQNGGNILDAQGNVVVNSPEVVRHCSSSSI